MSINYKDIQESMVYFAGVDLTTEQIDAILATLSEEERQSIAGGFDTVEREYFMDALVQFVTDGVVDHWPLNLERGTEFETNFPVAFIGGCEKHQIKIVE